MQKVTLKLEITAKFAVVGLSVKSVSFSSGGFAPLTRDFAQDPLGAQSPLLPSPQTSVVALDFGFRFVCGSSFQISCRPTTLIYNNTTSS